MKGEHDIDQLTRIINAIPDPVVVTQGGKVVLSNEAAKLFEQNLEGMDIEGLLKEMGWLAKIRTNLIIENKQKAKTIDYTVYMKNGKTKHFEFNSTYVEFDDKPAVLSIARDITTKKNDLDSAARMQKLMMMKKLPEIENTLISTVYLPARTVSGDFYFIEAISENCMVGILGDVRGKGILAAMNISAFGILFKEGINDYVDIDTMLNRLNKKVSDYFGDDYVAAMLFTVQRDINQLTIVSAGINELKVVDKDGNLETYALKGPFLGMFDHLEFDHLQLNLDECSKLILYTDGIEEQLHREEVQLDDLKDAYLFKLTAEMTRRLEEKSSVVHDLPDDCTLLALDFNFNGKTSEFTLEGINEYDLQVQKIIKAINRPEYAFDTHLILMELLTNAYKYGNKNDPNLPIKIRITQFSDKLVIQVIDFGLTRKNISIKTEITDDELLDENGRGLFLVNCLADQVYINGNSMIVELYYIQ